MAANDHTRRTSLYVGDLHPEATEKDLTETFSRVGPLLSVHLCRDKSTGKSLCYAYVNFWLPCHALTAVKCLNHTTMMGKSMRIMWYERNPSIRMNGMGNLFVKNLDQSITSARLEAIFSKYGTILSCKVAEQNGISKGFGFVQFDSEDSAMAALAALHETELEGKKLYVSKFQNKFERKGAEQGDKFSEHGEVSRALNFDSHGSRNQFMKSKGSNLFVKNLDASVDERKLEELFSTYGKVISANVIRAGGVSRRFGFVCFSRPEDAKKALISLSGAKFEGRTLYVAMAWPKKQEARNSYKPFEKFPPQPLYTSNYYPHLSSPTPFNQPIPFYRPFVSPFDSPNLVQALNFSGTCYPLPMNLAAMGGYGQQKYLEMSKGQLPPSILHGKIVNGNGKELRKGFSTTKTFCLESSTEINKIDPSFLLQKIQTMQIGKLKLVNGGENHGKELCKVSDSLDSSPEISKKKSVCRPGPLVETLEEVLKSPEITSAH